MHVFTYVVVVVRLLVILYVLYLPVVSLCCSYVRRGPSFSFAFRSVPLNTVVARIL
jgi:hypothetical protein